MTSASTARLFGRRTSTSWRRGVRFDRAYSQYPLCSPSRSSLLTGRRPNATGVVANPDKNPMSPHFREKLPDAVTLPELFRTSGYLAARVGKLYHYGVPLNIGTAGLDDYRSWDLTINPRGRDREILDRVFSLKPGQFGATLSWLADDGQDAEHTDGIAAAEAVRLLERFKRNKESFFLAVGFYRPHTPYVAPKRYFDMYPRDRIALPALVGRGQVAHSAGRVSNAPRIQGTGLHDRRAAPGSHPGVPGPRRRSWMRRSAMCSTRWTALASRTTRSWSSRAITATTWATTGCGRR